MTVKTRKPRKTRARKTKVPAPDRTIEFEAPPPVGGEGAAERGEGAENGEKKTDVLVGAPTKDESSPLSLDCPKCSTSGKYRGGACFRCKEKGTQDHSDLERNRLYDLNRHGPSLMAMVSTTIEGVERTKPLPFARVTEVFRIDSFHGDGRLEKVVPGRLAKDDRIVIGSPVLNRLLEVTVVSVEDMAPRDRSF